MGKQFKELSSSHIDFIFQQHIFFVGTAAETGKVNVSPKGTDSFRVISPNMVVWLNLTGSGNETAAHLLLQDRMTIMLCAFKGNPIILRLYGHAKAYHESDKEYQEYIDKFTQNTGARQIIIMHIDMVQTSCGMAVPYMDFVADRTALTDWADKKGRTEIKEYWNQKNQKSLDGFDTNIPLD